MKAWCDLTGASLSPTDIEILWDMDASYRAALAGELAVAVQAVG